jgi:transmembrane sensor
MKPSEISAFLEKYASGTHTPGEHQEFINWLNKATPEEISNYADQYYAIAGKGQPAEEQVNAELVMQIERALDRYELGKQEPVKNAARIFHWRTIFRSAAAILFLFLSAYFVYTLIPHNSSSLNVKGTQQAVDNEVQPGGNKAVLALGNGETVLLDEAKPGEVARQGNTQVYKTANGEVVYKSGDKSTEEFVYHTLSTPRGGQYKLLLPDGSNVWLNSASSVRYPTVFAGAERTVEVTGEVYFEIAHDASKPFVVKVNEMDIRVLGTHFNVNAYSDERSVNTTLLEGSVMLSKGGYTAKLRPGQQAQIADRTDFKLLNDVDVDEVVAWKNGYFSFNRADLHTVMRQIARWYDVTISYEGQIPHREFVGKIKRNNNASEVLKILQESKVHFRIEGKKIIVMP